MFVVDDDARVIKALSRLLRMKGYDVRSYTSPQEFLSNHDATVPGCAVLDVSMPGLDGLELQQALAAGGSHRPVIFLTGKGDIPTSVRAMKAGAIDFLTKPVSNQDLLGAIARAEEQDTRTRQNSRRIGIDRGEDCDLDPARTRSARACCRRTPQQADRRRAWNGRQDDQVPPQCDDAKAGDAHCRRSRAHGEKGRRFKIGRHAALLAQGSGRQSSAAATVSSLWRKQPVGSPLWTMTRPC